MAILVLPESIARLIEAEGVRHYPEECCGILIGRDVNASRRIEEIRPVNNAFDADRLHDRFLISPQAIYQTEKELENSGRTIVGFYHSHPDHPARPSDYDREHAWPFYSYVIVSIAAAQAVDMTSWVLDETSHSFRRQDIQEISTES
jgi:proteasome lid subunit RPN8/RPN11